MIRKLYIHNFRCLENFELNIEDISSGLLIGENGSGKSTVGKTLELLQSIGRGINRMNELEKHNILSPKDFARGRSDVPIRFEIEALLDNKVYKYVLALELPENFKELRVSEEQLIVSGNLLYSREKAQVSFYKSLHNSEAQFLVDWHIVALPLIQEQSDTDPLHIFKSWLAHMIILCPIPGLIKGESSTETLEPERNGSNFGSWFSGLLSRSPAAYTQIDAYLKTTMPDIQDVMNELIGKNSKNMIVRFKKDNAELSIDFTELSDGEKCFFLCAVVLAANKSYGPLFCFWDEPDNHLSLSELGHFIMSLRRSFKNHGQLLATSHNEEAIKKFSMENTFMLYRKSHLEPTLIKHLRDIPISNDLIDALILGDIEL